ncbi:hypothetical protein RRG08_020121 [Elysia crispata]|uniref:Uncharacterized protein n=1 Tax=Elysia crispata TaxID=231223 RepID=A0AAE1A6M7_9GAST|nr:hypothetical protein RRG08_020121 [Elysia crispata]
MSPDRFIHVVNFVPLAVQTKLRLWFTKQLLCADSRLQLLGRENSHLKGAESHHNKNVSRKKNGVRVIRWWLLASDHWATQQPWITLHGSETSSPAAACAWALCHFTDPTCKLIYSAERAFQKYLSKAKFTNIHSHVVLSCVMYKLVYSSNVVVTIPILAVDWPKFAPEGRVKKSL